MVFHSFWAPRPSNFEAELAKKTSPERSNIKGKNAQHLDAIFDQFENQLGSIWEAFGGQVGAKLAPNGNKTRPHNQSKT